MTDYRTLRDDPVRPLPCRGCVHLSELGAEFSPQMHEGYLGCSWWLDAFKFPIPHHDFSPDRHMKILPRKAVDGPHEGELLLCDVFTPKKDL